MNPDRSFRRATRLGGAAVCTLAFSLGAGLVAKPAEASGKRLAYSQRLGAEIFAVGADTDWCREQVTVQIVADSKALFDRPDFESLVKSLGSKVLAAECPAARRLVISGVEKATGAVAWSGHAVHGGWKPVQTVAAQPVPAAPASVGAAPLAPAQDTAQAPTAAAPDAARSAEAEPRSPALPVPSSPLGGEWTAQAKCLGYDQANTTATLSVYEVSGNRFKAVWEARSERYETSRFYVDGQFDDLTNQVSAEQTRKGTIRNGAFDRLDLKGAFDAANGRITARGVCYGDVALTLTRQSATPTTAHRVLVDAANEKAWTEAEINRPRDWWIVGKLPKGEFRAPSCEDLVAWARMFPADQRVRLFPNSRGMLRHYDDATTQRVFGAPAYYWLGAEATESPGHIARNACRNYHRNDPDMRQLRVVTEDYVSIQEMKDRRRYNVALAGIAPYLATRGDEPAEAVALLNKFASLEAVEDNIQRFQLNARDLSAEEKVGVAKDVARYKGMLAEKAGQTQIAAIASLPPTLDSLDRIAGIKTQFVALFGAPSSAAVSTAADGKLAEVAKAVVATAVAELGNTPRTFDGMMDADLKTSAIREKLAAKDGKANPAYEPMLRDLEAAENRFRLEARDAVIKSAQERIAATPATVAGVRELQANAQDLERALGKDTGPLFEPYRKAVAAKTADIGMELLPALKTQINGLPTSWTSVQDARRIAAEQAAQFAGTPAEAAFRKAGEERVQAILSELADQATLDVKAVQTAGLKGIGETLAEAAKAAKAFDGVDGGKPLADRIREAGRKRANEIGEAYLPEFRSEVKNAPASRFTAIQMAAASIVLDEHGKDIPAMGKLRDASRERAIAIYSGVCDKALSDAGMGSSDGNTELVVGSELTTLKQFVCDLHEGGIRATKFETPGLMKSLTGGEKEYVLRVYGPEDWLQQAALRTIGFAPRASRRFNSIDDLFDFGGVKPAGDALTKPAIESPAKIVFKEMEVRQDKKALVGVQIGDDAKTESLSLKQWREVSSLLSSVSKDGIDAAKLCASWAQSGRKNLSHYESGLALLSCQTNK